MHSFFSINLPVGDTKSDITIILDIILDGLHVFIPLCSIEWMIYLMRGLCGGGRGRHHMVAGFTTTYAINAYYY
jgi:hypothetical protein